MGGAMKPSNKQTTSKPKGKKLKVNKKTIQDLDTRKVDQIKGGVPKPTRVMPENC